MTVGSTISTCVRCHGEWYIVLITLGQLTSWGFAILNDGIRGDKTADYKDEDGKQNIKLSRWEKIFGPSEETMNKIEKIENNTKGQNRKNRWYKIFGLIFVI